MDAKVKTLYRKISRDAAAIANERMREEILGPMSIEKFKNPVTGGQVVRGAGGRFVSPPSRFSQGVQALSAKNLRTMKKNWNPFSVDWTARELGIRINDLDNIYLSNLQAHDQIEQIVTDSVQKAIMLNSKEFFTHLLNQWIALPREDLNDPLADAFLEIMEQYGYSAA
jgi:hypothetical protein